MSSQTVTRTLNFQTIKEFPPGGAPETSSSRRSRSGMRVFEHIDQTQAEKDFLLYSIYEATWGLTLGANGGSHALRGVLAPGQVIPMWEWRDRGQAQPARWVQTNALRMTQWSAVVRGGLMYLARNSLGEDKRQWFRPSAFYNESTNLETDALEHTTDPSRALLMAAGGRVQTFVREDVPWMMPMLASPNTCAAPAQTMREMSAQSWCRHFGTSIVQMTAPSRATIGASTGQASEMIPQKRPAWRLVGISRTETDTAIMPFANPVTGCVSYCEPLDLPISMLFADDLAHWHQDKGRKAAVDLRSNIFSAVTQYLNQLPYEKVGLAWVDSSVDEEDLEHLLEPEHDERVTRSRAYITPYDHRDMDDSLAWRGPELLPRFVSGSYEPDLV